MMIQEMLQVENVFHLQVIGEGDDTQLSLSWRTLDEKKKETDVCMGCGTFQLNDKVDGLVEKLVGVKKEVVVKEEPPKKVETKKSVSAPRIKRQQTKAKAEEQQLADEEKRLEEERKLLEAEKKRFAETQHRLYRYGVDRPLQLRQVLWPCGPGLRDECAAQTGSAFACSPTGGTQSDVWCPPPLQGVQTSARQYDAPSLSRPQGHG